MDIKKPDSALMGATPAPTNRQAGPKQTGQSHNQPSQQTSPLDFKSGSAKSLKIGQQLDLVVLKITNSSALLEILGSNIKAHTSDKALLQLGQKLRAQITQTQPIIQLKILSTSATSVDTIQTLITDTLRQSLPQQQPLRDLLRNIQLLTNTNTEPNPSLQKIKEAFIQSTPPAQAFSEAKILPQVLKRSGLFTENILANMIKNPAKQSTFPNNDLKISLLRLATQLRALQTYSTVNKTTQQLPPESTTKNIQIYSPALLQQNQKNIAATIKQTNQAHSSVKQDVQIQQLSAEKIIEKLLHLTEGSIAKLQTQQLQQQQLTEVQKPAWTFELPIRSDSSLDNVTIYINKDESNKNTHYQSPWKLVIKLSIEPLGEIQANISLRGNKISVIFWLDKIQTSSLFTDNLQMLKSKLNKVGLEPDKLKCHCDKPPPVKTPLLAPTLNEEI